MRFLPRYKFAWAVLWRHPGYLLWIVLAYLPFLGRMSVPLTGDQKVYLSTAMEMRLHGSWLRPLLFGEPSYYKPPFQYWATLVGWNVFGFNLWGALIPSLLALVVTAWLLGEISALLHQRKAAWGAGLVFAATLGSMTYGTTAQMEIYLCLFYAASWWAGLKFLAPSPETRHWGWLYLAFAVAGLSALVKSPLYSVFWVVSFISYLVLDGEWELFGRWQLYVAWLLGIALAVPWFACMLLTDRERFWHDYFMRETWEKKNGNDSSLLSLWGALLYFSLPFTLLVLPSVRGLFSRKWSASVLRFVACWAWPPAVFFSFYPYRIKPYLYLLVPLVALLVEWATLQHVRTRFFRALLLVTGAMVFVAFTLLAAILGKIGLVPVWIAIGFVLVGVAAVASCWRTSFKGLVLFSLVGWFLVRGAAVSLGEQDIRDLRTAVGEQPNAGLAMLDERKNIWHEVGLLSVAVGRPILRTEDAAQAVEALRGGSLLLLTDEQAQRLSADLVARLRSAGDSRSVRERPWFRWRARFDFPYRELLKQSAGPDLTRRLQREFRILSLTS